MPAEAWFVLLIVVVTVAFVWRERRWMKRMEREAARLRDLYRKDQE
jgi:hypothetical protein